MRLQEAHNGGDLDRIERLLRVNDLPHEDLDSSPVRLFVGYEDDGASEDDRFVGTGGLEICGADALLRSVVVPEELRGRGFGEALYRALEARARGDGVERLYLLTTTAEVFFAGQGFEVVERDDAPEPIRGTAEFRELCSSEATCMWKAIR